MTEAGGGGGGGGSIAPICCISVSPSKAPQCATASAVVEADEVEDAGRRSAGRWPARPSTRPGACRGTAPGSDEHALADHVLDLAGDVRERCPEHGEELLDALAGRRKAAERLVLDEVLREQLVDHVQVAFVDDLVVEPLHHVLVAVRDASVLHDHSFSGVSAII